MTAPMPPVIKAVVACERALDRLDTEDRVEAVSLLVPNSTPADAARLRMGLEACVAVVAPNGKRKGDWPFWVVHDIAKQALS